MSNEQPVITIQMVLDNLETDWKTYPKTFFSLDDAARSTFLSTQGYTSFHDLLAHILAWWEEAIMVIDSILDLREIPSKEYDLDAFNAAAIEKYKSWSEDDLLIHFENLRQQLIDLVADLPPDSLSNKRISSWLDGCLLDHYKVHRVQ